MPAFVVIITLLSVLSFLYATKAFFMEAHHLQLATAPFGGGIGQMMQHGLRVCVAAIFAGLSLGSVVMSIGLVWLAMQPSMVG